MKMDSAETLSYAEIKTVKGKVVPQTTIFSSDQKEKSKERKRERVKKTAKVKAN